MRILLLLMIMVVFAWCNDARDEKSTTTTDTTTVEIPQNDSPTRGDTVCYLETMEKDSFFARLVENGDRVTGRLEFRNYQKDKSRGPVTGRLHGDTVKLWYEFDSEGMHSIMEVYFLKKGDKLIRGVGDMNNRGDSTYFTNPSRVSFDTKQEFERVDCEVGRR